MSGPQPPHTLRDGARAVVSAKDPVDKVAIARATAQRWRGGGLAVGGGATVAPMPDRPGRPDRPQLLAPRDMPRRATSGAAGRLALLHALAHIELNAIDLAWDLVGRFAHVPMPRAFFDDWARVGSEEAVHFELVNNRLAELGGSYGELPAHDGLWEAAQETAHDLTARVAIVPLVLEARGLDVTPAMIDRMRRAGDDVTAAVLATIYRDEIGHVAIGARWFRYLCARERTAPEARFHQLVRAHFRGGLKPPFNESARSQAGLSPGFYKPLVGVGGFD